MFLHFISFLIESQHSFRTPSVLDLGSENRGLRASTFRVDEKEKKKRIDFLFARSFDGSDAFLSFSLIWAKRCCSSAKASHTPRVFELGELGFVFANCTLVLYSFCTASMSLWYLKCLLQIIGHFLLLCDLRNLKIQEPHFLIRPQPSISQSNPFLFPSNRGGFSSNLCSQASFCLNKVQIILPRKHCSSGTSTS